MLNQTTRLHGLRCLVALDAETNRYLAYCLDVDVVESGATSEDAWENLKEVLKAHISYSYNRCPEAFTQNPDTNLWNRFFELSKAKPDALTTEKFEIELMPPLPDAETNIWIQRGVEDAQPVLANA